MIRNGTSQLLLGDYRTCLDNFTADLILTSPPYNIGSKQPASTGKRNKRLGTYDPKSYRSIREYPDSMPEDKYQESQIEFMAWARDHLSPGGTLAYNHKPRRRDGRMIHPMEWLLKAGGLVLMEEVIWDRGSTHNHCCKMMWPHTERVYIFRKPGGKYKLDNRSHLQFRSDIWRIPPEQTGGGKKDHNAPFPLALASHIVEAWSMPGDVVMDPYAGSGTTAIAAIDRGRMFVGAERLKKYHTLANSRIDGCLYAE